MEEWRKKNQKIMVRRRGEMESCSVELMGGGGGSRSEESD